MFFFTILTLTSKAQDFQLSGQILRENNDPVEFAEILLLQNDLMTKYQLTDDNGKFILTTAPGNFLLLVRQLGDTLYKKDIEIVQDKDVGSIIIRQGSKLLQEVTIVAKKKLMERKTDYN